MENYNIENMVSEIRLYLHNVDTKCTYDNILLMVGRLDTDSSTKLFLDECLELRGNIISFKIRDIKMRIDETENLITSIRYNNQGDKYELACLETLYRQSSDFSNTLCTLRKLDILLLSITSIIKDIKFT